MLIIHVTLIYICVSVYSGHSHDTSEFLLSVPLSLSGVKSPTELNRCIFPGVTLNGVLLLMDPIVLLLPTDRVGELRKLRQGLERVISYNNVSLAPFLVPLVIISTCILD